jgi:hypothetical protein
MGAKLASAGSINRHLATPSYATWPDPAADGVADTWNDHYYGQKLLPADILVRASTHNANADQLAALLERASSGSRPN